MQFVRGGRFRYDWLLAQPLECSHCSQGPPPFIPGSWQNPVARTKGPIMKSDIHPKYEAVVFNDLASGTQFLTKSTVSSSKTIEWEDGNTYPVIDVEISSESHPFYTGKQRIMDSAGRVERFNARFKGFGGKK
ncbi:50S ribosomal protein L31 type B [Arthrobacter sp. Rue61a]|nr:ribosomal protein L31 [Paenarthrobacter aurescens TC1]AFR29186.1 50S ribosomal protein L31 type B [Arthrobacter sp. Rue61a]